MSFKKLSTGAALGIALLGLPAAHADVILTYTGNNFNTFPVLAGPYTTSDKVTASITLANPLGDNLNLDTVTPLAFSVNDGVQTITDATASSNRAFLFSTDAHGNITQWIVNVKLAATPFDEIDTDNAPPNPGIFDQTSIIPPPSAGNAQIVGSPGTWTTTMSAVPAPPLSNWAGLGLLGLVFLWRRRQQIFGLAW